jgi:hypothetical protein
LAHGEQRLVVEILEHPLLGQLHAVALQAGKDDLQVLTAGNRVHLVGQRAGLGVGCGPIGWDEGEGHAVHVGVLGLEAALSSFTA